MMIRCVPYLLWLMASLGAAVSGAFAQGNPTIQGNYSGNSHVILGEDYIRFKPEFEYLSEQDNTLLATFGRYQILDDFGGYLGNQPGTFGIPAEGEEGVVGGTETAFDVNQLGVASYSIPIIVSPGTNDMQPSLAIAYSHQGGDGPLGKGFAIAGLSAITRVNATEYHDGEADRIDFDEHDRLALDGERLIRLSGTYGADGSEYRLENNRMAKIVAYGTDGSGFPLYFKVWEKSGLIKTYGTTTDSRMLTGDHGVLTWALTKVEDRAGNYMTYHYARSSTEQRIAEIKYTGNDAAGLQPYASVKFEYEDRAHERNFFVVGHEYKLQKRLSNVKSFYGTDLVRDYRLSYQEIDDAPHLTSVTEYNAANEHYNPIQFRWNQSGQRSFETTESDTYITMSTWDNVTVNRDDLLGDFTGNGKSEILSFLKVTGEYDTGNGHITRTTQGFRVLHKYEDGEIVTTLQSSDPQPTWRKYPGDFNGDGLTDYMALDSDNTCKVYFSTGSGFELGIDQYLPTSKDFEWLQLGDFDGDGKTDLLVFKTRISNSGEAIGFKGDILYNQGHIFLTNKAPDRYEWIWDNDRVAPGFQFLVTDLNGDGKADIYTGIEEWHIFQKEEYLLFAGNQRWDFTRQEQEEWPGISRRIANRNAIRTDFNGDGIFDVLDISDFSRSEPVDSPDCSPPDPRHPDPEDDDYMERCFETRHYWRLYMGTGTGFKVSLIERPQAALGDPEYYLGDFNGDGRSDVGTRHGGTIRIHVLRDLTEFIQVESIQVGESDDVFVTDFTGNGISDIATMPRTTKITKTDPTCELSGQEDCDYEYISQAVTMHTDYVKAPAMVDGFANSYGSRVYVNYAPLTNDEVYTKGFRDLPEDLLHLQAAMYVVRSVHGDNGIGGLSDTGYTYHEAKLHTAGKGFLGFCKRTVDDRTQRTLLSEYYSLNDHFVPLLDSQEVESTITGGLISKTSVKYRDLPDGLNQTSFLAKSEEEVMSYDIYSGHEITSLKTTYNQYDAYGNILEMNQVYGSGHRTQTKSTYDYSGVGTWILGRLKTTRVTKTAPGEGPSIRNSAFTYYPNHFLESEFVEPEHELSLKTTYTYDGFANILTSTTTGVVDRSGNTQSRTIAYGFDTKGRFVQEESNALGHQVSKTFDDIFGNVLTETSPNGLRTRYDYDNFGRLTSATDVDKNISSTTAYHWADGSGPGHTRYYSTTTTTGSAPGKTYFDRLNRQLRSAVERKGRWVMSDKQYNSKGQVGRASQSYFEDTNPQWTSYTYDPIGRVAETIEPGNRITHNAYAGLITSTRNAKGHSVSASFNMLEQRTHSTDAKGNDLQYEYYSSGLLKSIQDPATNITTLTYDRFGNQTSVNDPDLGTIHSEYNAFGEVIYQRDAEGYETTFEYDILGRAIERKIAKGADIDIATWTYDSKKIGLLSSSSNGAISKEFFYDDLLQPTLVREILEGRPYETGYSYDNLGRVTEITYPSGFKVAQGYDDYGHLMNVAAADGSIQYWQADAENANGQLTEFTLGSQIKTSRDYDPRTGLIRSVMTTATGVPGMLQHDGYTFDKLNNLTSRTNYLLEDGQGITEHFQYDELNRLEVVNFEGVELPDLVMEYDLLGNLTYKSDVGTYHYDSEDQPGKPHAVKYIELNGTAIPAVTQDITYTGFNKVRSITEGDARIDFVYGIGHERKVTRTTVAGITMTKRFIGGLYEEEESDDGTLRKVHYIKAGGEAIAIHTEEDDQSTDHFLLKDHLGSMSAIVSVTGEVLERYSYDAWGNRRDAQTWGPLDGATSVSYARGFTGHEHLGLFALINMNGRMYDPVIGRFLSPDPYTQSPDFTQGLNRYSYVFNNPLSMTDPSGYISVGQILGVAAAVLTSAILTPAGGFATLALLKTFVVGAAAGFAGSFVGALAGGASFGDALMSGLRAAPIAAITAGISFGIGELFDDVVWAGKEFARATTHGLAQGGMRAVTGGNFWHGFISGFSTSGVASIMRDLNYVEGLAVTVAVGGATEAISGGSFEDGALTGAMVYLMNHTQHSNRDKAVRMKRTVIRIYSQQQINSIRKARSWKEAMRIALYSISHSFVDDWGILSDWAEVYFRELHPGSNVEFPAFGRAGEVIPGESVDEIIIEGLNYESGEFEVIGLLNNSGYSSSPGISLKSFQKAMDNLGDDLFKVWTAPPPGAMPRTLPIWICIPCIEMQLDMWLPESPAGL